MRFIYEYRTSDNAVHNGVVSASNRDAAFALLKSQGVRPSRLTDAPGFFNHLFGRGKRWIAIAVLCVLCLALCALAFSFSHQAKSTRHQAQDALSIIDSPVRHQLIGDAAVIEKGIRTGWADVFDAKGDRFLASFAIPGHPVAVRTTTEAELLRALSNETGKATSLESRQIVSIVNGMKSEIRALLGSGWTSREVGAALVRRQEREILYYQMAEREIQAAKKQNAAEADLLSLWEKKNNELRNLGIKLVPMPE